MGLDASQIKQFTEQGYLVIPDFLTSKQTNALCERTDELLHELPLDGHPMTKFSTGEREKHVGDDYFLTSGDKIRYFFEEDAFDQDGVLTKPKTKAVNKIAHALHVLDPQFRQVSTNTQISEIARDLGFVKPQVLQSMVICKSAHIGGSVPCHQDSVFLYTKPTSAIGFWFAMQDAKRENGALEFVPGSHRWAQIAKRFVRLSEGGTGFEDLPGVEQPLEPSDKDYVMTECTAGSLLLIHGNILHRSAPNRSPRSRYAYTFHCIEGNCEYDGKNWLQTPDGFVNI